MNAIQISNVTIQQTNNLYCLNDLHKASGGNSKHQPAFWLRQQQIQEVIAELKAEGREAVKVVNGGKNRGTFVCKELVYAYATWISAKFFLLVIRTFDEVVSGSLKTQTAKLGCLTIEQQDEIKKFHRELVQSAPKEKQAALAIGLWSAIKTKFGVGYKEVPEAHYPEVLSLMARVGLEKGALYGEVLDKPKTLTCPDPKLLHNTLAKAVVHFRDYGKLLQVVDKLPWTDNRMAFNTFNNIQEVCDNIVKIATDWELKNELGEPIFAPCRINFYNGSALVW